MIGDLTDRAGRATVIGIALTALWLVMLLIFWLTADGSATGVRWWLSATAALLPLGMIWMAVNLARAIATLQDEADRLRAQVAQMRDAPAEPAPPVATRVSAAPTPTEPPPPAARRAAPAPAPSVRMATPRVTDIRQTSLGLDTPEPVEVDPETLIMALNFPDGPDDAPAIAAMRDALRDPESARIIRSAQDVVTLLAEAGIYMDDLTPARTDAAAWRRFADGQRGAVVSSVGAIHDAEAIAQAAATMRADDVFRDAAHHFLRLFDRTATRILPDLDDGAIDWLANTRSARAFMLLGRAAGLFGQPA